VGAAFLPKLQLVLRTKHGSTAAAWRMAMDPKFTGSVSFGNFLLVLEDCAFQGNVKALWKMLSGDRTTITFQDLDAGAQKLLDAFRASLLQNFGSVTEAWAKGLNEIGRGKVDKKDFLDACEKHALGSNPEKVFKALLARPGQRSLCKEDLRALLIGIPPEQIQNVWDGASSAQGVDPLSPRDSAKVRIDEDKSKDRIVSSVDGFKKMLIVKYGSLFSAWRNSLDTDHNGIMAQADFANACRDMGIKNITSLWGQLDPMKLGHVTLKDFDNDSNSAITEFTALLLAQAPTTKEAWTQFFMDPKKALGTDLKKFTVGCQEIGFGCMPPEKAFKLFRPEAGRHHLDYHDLFKNFDRNQNFPGKEPGQPWSKDQATTTN